MTRVGKTVYQVSRIMAGLTRSDAAYSLGLSERTLARYEGGESSPDDAVVANMANLYKDRMLAVQHIMLSPVGRFIFRRKKSATSAATLRALKKGRFSHD